MKKRKQRISLLAFLQTGRLGALQPCRDLSPEALAAMLGPPDEVETQDGVPYAVESTSCFPVIACYGSLEFHFDSGRTLYCVFSDNPWVGQPYGGRQIRFADSALLRYGRPMAEFLRLAQGQGLPVQPCARPGLLPYAHVLRTAGGVELGFEVDDPDDRSEQPTLRWWSWQA
ncbi:hypothetical protein [Comamonas sp. GB3 AK4-5]|uniref:hypothetical protein n=1 Tax=Comamonas sp. GB3 AK4-5 TaxID=3231487 RepID=UPI00351DC04D